MDNLLIAQWRIVTGHKYINVNIQNGAKGTIFI